MLLATLRERIAHLAKFNNTIRRAIRRNMKKVYDNLRQYENETSKQLRAVSDKGDVDEVERFVRIAEKQLLEEGELLVIKEEIDVEIIEHRVADSLSDVNAFMNELKNAIMSAGIDEEKKEQLNAYVNDVKKQLKGMYGSMMDEIKKEYQPLFEQQQAIEEGRYGEDHWMAVRAQGFARLTKAMHEVFQIPKEKRTIDHDVNHIKDIERAMTKSLVEIHKNAETVAKEWPKIVNDEKKLTEAVTTLSQHVVKIFEDFTHILRVFVMYFFLIQAQKKDLDGFIDGLREHGFPKSHLTILEKEKKNFEAQIKKKAKEAPKLATTLRHAA